MILIDNVEQLIIYIYLFSFGFFSLFLCCNIVVNILICYFDIEKYKVNL